MSSNSASGYILKRIERRVLNQPQTLLCLWSLPQLHQAFPYAPLCCLITTIQLLDQAYASIFTITPWAYTMSKLVQTLFYTANKRNLFKLTSTTTRSGPWREACAYMFMAALFTTGKKWKQPKCPPTNEWINNIWHTWTMEYFSALRRKEILT